MSLFAIILLSLTVWFIAGVVYILRNLGNKHTPEPWYAWVLGAPAMLFIVIWCAPRDLREWWYLHYPYASPRIMEGRVEKADFTWGQGGNQWTTINHGRDHIRYATFWDAYSKDWEIGEMVQFEARWERLHLGRNEYKRVLHARNIKSLYKLKHNK